jgi:chorismate mutase
MNPLVELVARRVALGDLVAAAKFGTTVPIDDPYRERSLLRQVIGLSAKRGIDPAFIDRFFRAQIEANKAVQRSLHALWKVEPGRRPARRPDLAREVRPQLDQLTTAILDELAKDRSTIARTRLGVVELRAATQAADGIHRDAILIALTPLCDVGA